MYVFLGMQKHMFIHEVSNYINEKRHSKEEKLYYWEYGFPC